MRRTSTLLLVGANPELHRHARSTFVDGTHREPPSANTRPWIDRKSPFQRFIVWITGPTSRLFTIGSWTCTSIVAYTAWCLSDDAKMTYLVNTALQRSVCSSSSRAAQEEVVDSA